MNMSLMYTDEQNAQILISLLKQKNIRRVIISPGTSNVCFAGSLLHDPYFILYSSVDERSAAYMACGIAEESGEPVVLSCTGATSSRNYMPGLTEAYYRKLPVLAVTSSQRSSRIGHNIDQVTDRTLLPRDVAVLSVQMPVIHDDEDRWSSMINANKALIALTRNGGGPVHINLETNYSNIFDVQELPSVRNIIHYESLAELPEFSCGNNAIIIGAHAPMGNDLVTQIEEFCTKYNCVVLCDHTSNYTGKYKIIPNALLEQQNFTPSLKTINLAIHIGDITATRFLVNAKEIWRVSIDGELRDPYRKLTKVFQCKETEFFKAYNKKNNRIEPNHFWNVCKSEYTDLYDIITSINYPLSNIWVALNTISKIPTGSELHLAIRNSIRTWNYFELPKDSRCFCNTGGFGIDGCTSSFVGASLVDTTKLYYLVTGDLAFFYDMNALGNRQIGGNIRILLINNGTAMEMKYRSNLTSLFENEDVSYMAATGHFGFKSKDLVKHLSEDLGFNYFAINTKDDFETVLPTLVCPQITEKPIIVEVFTDSSDEQNAYDLLCNAKSDTTTVLKNKVRDCVNFFRK